MKRLDYYERKFAARRLLFDDELVKINDRLSLEGNPSRLDSKGLAEGLVAVLDRVEAIYKKHWWPSHDKSNQDWIAFHRPIAEKTAPEVVAELEKIFRHRWYAPHLVDVTYFVAELGHAYTTDDLGHTTLASSEKGIQGFSGIEILFHEGAHTMTPEIESALNAECRSVNKKCG